MGYNGKWCCCVGLSLTWREGGGREARPTYNFIRENIQSFFLEHVIHTLFCKHFLVVIMFHVEIERVKKLMFHTRRNF